MPLTRIPGPAYDFRNNAIDAYNQAYAEKAAELGVPYLDLFTQFSTDPVWDAALRRSDGLHPNLKGYEMMAARIGGWAGWRGLFDG